MRFEYLEPRTIEEAMLLLTESNGRAKIMAGGTDLLVKMRQGVIKAEYVVDISYIPGLNYIRYDEKRGLSIGALTTIRSLEKSGELRPKYPILIQAASQLASVGVRNMATIGGNLCNAAPSADTAPALIGLSADARIVGPGGERVVPLKNFFTGPGKTVLRIGELLVEIRVPVPPRDTKGVYLKYGVRGAIDLAIVGVAVIAAIGPGKLCKDINIVFGAVAPVPMRAEEAERILKDNKITESLIERSSQVASDQTLPISDVRASAAYRKEMVKVFTRQALREVFAM